MCKKTMVPIDCTDTEISSSHSLHNSASLSEDEHDDDCCEKSGSSLEDTLSLTCDESSCSISSSSVENDSSSDSEIDVYESPHLLRRRLLPLAPSPIIPQSSRHHDVDHAIHQRPFENKVSWRKGPSIRMVWFMMGLAWISYLLAVSANYDWVRDTPQDVVDMDNNNNQDTNHWRRFLRRRAPKILQKLPSKSSGREYTIRIRGHRVDLLIQSFDFHASCPSVREVQVEWTDPKNKQPPLLLKHKSGKVKPFGKPPTSAVFLLDEDLILSCQDIERAFHEWRLNPSRLVGFYPFHQSKTNTNEASSSEFHLQPVSRGGPYSIVSDRAVFIHNHILRSIPKPPQECQHLGMSIIVSSMTSKPPVAVLSKPHTVQPNKRKTVFSKQHSLACQRWIESIGVEALPDQVATIVGNQ